MRTIDTCLNCTDREVGCHGKCEKYKAAKAAYASQKQKAQEKKRAVRDFEDMEIEKRKRLGKNR